MPRPPDSFLKTAQFKDRLSVAGAYAKSTGLGVWPTRIFWIGLTENVMVARRYAMRRPNYEDSEAWCAYTNLIEAGIFSEDPEGVVTALEHAYWGLDVNCYEWMNTCISIAAGGSIPDEFPRR